MVVLVGFLGNRGVPGINQASEVDLDQLEFIK
jgi:hypothetical protein